jgi:hypothetical protein
MVIVRVFWYPWKVVIVSTSVGIPGLFGFWERNIGSGGIVF